MPMTKEELIELGQKRFGRAWQRKMAVYLGITEGQIYKYQNGQNKIPEPTARFLQLYEGEPGQS